MTRLMHTPRNGLICVMVCAACFLIAWPVAEMGFIDDWSYIKTAQVFAQTGHFVYNGWATAMLGWQIVWGALFIRLFGFSFTTVKLSTVPIALATVILFHSIQIRFGITPRNAAIGTLALGLSPLYVPLAVSYMSDVPGLFITLLCLYCCQRACAAHDARATIVWLCLAAIEDAAGGTARQTAWLGALVIVPSTGWLLRKRRGVLLTTALLFVGTTCFVYFCLRWYAGQPYAISESILKGSRLEFQGAVILGLVKMFGELLCLLLLVYPILVAWLPQLRRFNAASFAITTCVVLDWVLFQWKVAWPLPWIQDVLHSEFATTRDAQMLPNMGQSILPAPVSLAISGLLAGTCMVFILGTRSRLRDRQGSLASADWHEFFWLTLPFTLSYILVLLPRSMHASVGDRYLLPLIPLAIVFLIRLYQQSIAPDLPWSSVVTLSVYTLLAIAGTHDWFAWQRARLAAIDSVRATGVRRDQIQGGFEYDGWTQVEEGGHINDSRIAIPAIAYEPHPAIPQVADACRLDFAPFTPVVHPKYTVAFTRKACLSSSSLPPVQFDAWLPPFRRAIYVQEYPTASRGAGTNAP